MQDSFSFRESSAIFTDLSFLIVITAGETKQFSVVLSAFSKCPFSINFSNSFSRFFESVLVLVSPFVVSVLRLFSIECLWLSFLWCDCF